MAHELLVNNNHLPIAPERTEARVPSIEFPEAPEIETGYRTAYGALMALAPDLTAESTDELTVIYSIVDTNHVIEIGF
jgi:hypothetical protein